MSTDKLWPTPQANDVHASQAARIHLTEGGALRKVSKGTGNDYGPKLVDVAGLEIPQDTPPTSQLTLLPADSLASLSVSPGSDEARQMTAGSGLKCLESLRRSDRSGLLRRMLLGSSTWGSTIVYLTWRIAATLSNRILFQLVPSTPRTDGIESSLWATPSARADSRSEGGLASRGNHQVNLHLEVKMWPTPRASDGEKGGPNQKFGDGTPSLAATAAMLPTPQAKDQDLPTMMMRKYSWRDRQAGKPEAQYNPNIGGQLNPAWVCSMMGFPPGWLDIENDGPTEAGKTESPE